jgi:hypothetical protein
MPLSRQHQTKYFLRLGGTKHLPVFGGRASEGVRRCGRSPLEKVRSGLHWWEEKGRTKIFYWTHFSYSLDNTQIFARFQVNSVFGVFQRLPIRECQLDVKIKVNEGRQFFRAGNVRTKTKRLGDWNKPLNLKEMPLDPRRIISRLGTGSWLLMYPRKGILFPK